MVADVIVAVVVLVNGVVVAGVAGVLAIAVLGAASVAGVVGELELELEEGGVGCVVLRTHAHLHSAPPTTCSVGVLPGRHLHMPGPVHHPVCGSLNTCESCIVVADASREGNGDAVAVVGGNVVFKAGTMVGPNVSGWGDVDSGAPSG